MLVLEIDNARHHVTVLCYFRPNCDCGVSMHLDDLVAHEPSRQIKVVNRAVIKQHSIHVRLVCRQRLNILVPSNGLEDHRLANLASFYALHGFSMCEVVTSHETDLQAKPRFFDCLQGGMSAGESRRDRLFAQNMFARRGCGLDSLRMEFVW